MDTLLRMEKWLPYVEVYLSFGSLFSSGGKESDKTHCAGLL